VKIIFQYRLIFSPVCAIFSCNGVMTVENIRLERKKSKLTQKQLAEKLGVSDSTLSYWERGDFEPDSESLLKLANIFDVTVDYLLGRNRFGNTPELSENEIKFALLGDDENAEKQWAEVKQFVRFIKLRDTNGF
jgi:transcriptional regulator with XRE-family HTH domain